MNPQVRTRLAAMKYLAVKKPKKYKLVHRQYGRRIIKLMEYKKLENVTGWFTFHTEHL